MIEIKKLNTVFQNQEGLPKINRSPEGEAFGNAPSWIYLLDPSYQREGKTRNRALPKDNLSSLIETESVNGNPFFVTPNSSNQEAIGSAKVNTKEFTVFGVVDQKRDGATGASWITRSLSLNGGLSVAMRTSNEIALIWGTSEVRVTAPVPSETPFFFAVTFSISNGCKMFINGELVNEAQDFKALLDDDVRFMRRNSGTGYLKAGVIGILGEDLSQADKSGHLKNITDFYKQKFGIV